MLLIVLQLVIFVGKAGMPVRGNLLAPKECYSILVILIIKTARINLARTKRMEPFEQVMNSLEDNKAAKLGQMILIIEKMVSKEYSVVIWWRCLTL